MGPNKNGPNWRQADKEEEEGRTGGWRGGGRLAAMLAMLMPWLWPSLPLRLSSPTPSQKTRPLADAHPATPTKQPTTPFLAAAPAPAPAPARRRSRSRSRSSSPLPVRQPAGPYACLISFRLRYACLPSWGCSGLGFWSAPPPRRPIRGLILCLATHRCSGLVITCACLGHLYYRQPIVKIWIKKYPPTASLSGYPNVDILHSTFLASQR
ncbi:hypothetical protein PVAP13_9KG557001 [Panicum virgatum]|uniref:Uncharacterized protein n=1 Tax=Panicum virgatum TaxID=38727 RepID=A0A8T0P9T3_PANVG|nr:hypothetical protein PVAP13_9KG557001 [Panicum virgatum]